jgi:hypothetical protein
MCYMIFPTRAHSLHSDFPSVEWIGQKLSIPIGLSDEMDNGVALLAITAPATVWAVWHALVLRPRRRARRSRCAFFFSPVRRVHITDGGSHCPVSYRFFRAAREKFKDPTLDGRREATETLALLREPAARHMRTEHSRKGELRSFLLFRPPFKQEITNVTCALLPFLLTRVSLHTHTRPDGING